MYGKYILSRREMNMAYEDNMVLFSRLETSLKPIPSPHSLKGLKFMQPNCVFYVHYFISVYSAAVFTSLTIEKQFNRQYNRFVLSTIYFKKLQCDYEDMAK